MGGCKAVIMRRVGMQAVVSQEITPTSDWDIRLAYITKPNGAIVERVVERMKIGMYQIIRRELLRWYCKHHPHLACSLDMPTEHGVTLTQYVCYYYFNRYD